MGVFSYHMAQNNGYSKTTVVTDSWKTSFGELLEKLSMTQATIIKVENQQGKLSYHSSLVSKPFPQSKHILSNL